MPLVYIEGKKQMALQFFEKQLQLENDPAVRKELKAAIMALKAKMSKEKQDFFSESSESVTST